MNPDLQWPSGHNTLTNIQETSLQEFIENQEEIFLLYFMYCMNNDKCSTENYTMVRRES